MRDLFWNQPIAIPRSSWRWVLDGSAPPRIELDGGFDPGRWYRITYRASAPVVAGVGLAAIRDAASAFRYRSDLPVRGRTTLAFGNSQTGRFLRQFLHEGFNADEKNRRVFDGVWSHIAGAARGNYNRRFSTPGHGDMFAPTQFPFADADETDVTGARDGLQSRYTPDQRPKVFYTNTPVEYWGGGRAAALVHTSVDGTRDLTLPDNVRVYFLAGAQHIPGPFPPVRAPSAAASANPQMRLDGQELSNPVPHQNIARALLRALHDWVRHDTAPPPSRYPRLGDRTLVPIAEVAFPALPGVADPRRIVGPARVINGQSDSTPSPGAPGRSRWQRPGWHPRSRGRGAVGHHHGLELSSRSHRESRRRVPDAGLVHPVCGHPRRPPGRRRSSSFDRRTVPRSARTTSSACGRRPPI